MHFCFLEAPVCIQPTVLALSMLNIEPGMTNKFRTRTIFKKNSRKTWEVFQFYCTMSSRFFSSTIRALEVVLLAIPNGRCQTQPNMRQQPNIKIRRQSSISISIGRRGSTRIKQIFMIF